MFFSDLNDRMNTRIKRIVPLVLLVGVILGVSCVLQSAEAGESGSNLHLEWESEVPGRVVKVVNGKPERIYFRIRTEERVSRVKFGISRKDRSIGITISPEEAAVREGSAGSFVEFNIPRGMPLGRHNLAIRVIESGTDRLLGTGILPFILLPSGLECMC